MKTTLKILLGLSVAALVACGGSDTNPDSLKHLAVQVLPGSASVPTAGTAQFSASVTNSKKGTTTVTWSVQEPSGGAITPTGVYTAPTSAGTFHVVATADEDHATQATATVTVTAVSVAVSPDAPTVATGGAQAFTATVDGTANTAVTWSVQEADGGTINSSGYYTAPTTAGTYHVIATSVADATKSASVAVTVQNVTVAVSPSSADLDQGASQSFSATVAGTSSGAVIWSVQEANGGQVSSTGVYTAPAAAGTYHVVATSVADATKTTTVAVTVHAVTVTVNTAGSGNLDQGATRAFTATVTGTVNPAVSWSVQEANGGSVNGLGVYTAPAAAGTYHVVATSVGDPTASQTAAVDVNAVGLTLSSATGTLDQGATRAFTASVTGTVNTAVTWSVQEANGGAVDGNGVYTAPAAAGTYHVVATSAADTTVTQTAAVDVNAVAITISRSSTGSMDQGSTRTFTAAVTGTVNPAVTWSVVEATGGSIDANGLYTAPNNAGTFFIQATSAWDATVTKRSQVTIKAVQISALTPATVTLEANGVQAFSATVTGTVNTAITWSVQEAGGGTVDGSGTYIAPSAIGTYHVVATSAADATQQTSATITVPQAQGFTYVDPTSSGWRLVKNAASTSTHLVLDLVGPSGTTGKGVALTLNTDPNAATWTKVNGGDTEYLANVAYSLTESPALFKGTVKNGTLVAGVFQKGGSAVDVSGPVASVALDSTAAALVSGAAVPVGVVKAEALDGTGALAPITVAVGTLKAH